MRERRRGDRFLAIAVLGVVLLNYPLLSLFDRDGIVWGLPVLHLYVFGVWALLIALLAVVAERS
jgi:hypothetical protein